MHITDNIQNSGYSLYNSKSICEIDTFLLHTDISHLNENDNENNNNNIYPNDYYVINNYSNIYNNNDDNIIENNNHNEYIYFSNIIDIENDENTNINSNTNSVYQQYIDDIIKINDERDDMDIHSDDDDDDSLNDLEPLSDSSCEIHSIISKLISFQ